MAHKTNVGPAPDALKAVSTAPASLRAVLDELERSYGPPDDALDFLLDQNTRYAGLALPGFEKRRAKMAQVTIYLEPDVLETSKAAAARAQMSLSKWFSQLARAENEKNRSDWGSLFAQVDALRRPGEDDGLDFLLDDRTRYADLGEDAPRESFE